MYIKITFIILVFLSLLSCGNKDTKKQIITAGNTNNKAPTDIIAIGKIEPRGGIISIASQTSGLVMNVYKDDGMAVKKGEAIALIDPSSELLKLEQLKALLNTQNKQIEVYHIDSRAIASKLSNAKTNLQRADALFQKGVETKEAVDNLKTEVDLTSIELQKNNAIIAVAKAKVQELQAEINSQQLELDRKQITSPYTGVLLNVSIKKGNAISQFSNIADMATENTIIVRAEVDEMFASSVKQDQNVRIRLVGGDTDIAKGKIFYVAKGLKNKSIFSTKPDDQEDRRVREIKVIIENNSALLINTKVECIITQTK